MRVLAYTLATAAAVGSPLLLAAQGSGCGDTKFPPQLPPTTAVVDSAHAVADLAVFVGNKPMVFSLVFNKGDSVPRIRALDKNDVAAATALYNYVRHQPATADLWAIRIRISGGDTPALALERSQYCPPRPLSGEGRTSVTGDVQSSGRSPDMPSSGTLLRTGNGIVSKAGDVQYEALVAPDGHVIVARVLNASNSGETNADVVRRVQQTRFQPALLDDEPVPALFRSGGQSPRP
jgi:hypothetical protein